MHGQALAQRSALLFFLHYSGNAQLAGAISGMATGALTVIVWDYLPLVNGVTLYKATNLYSLVLGFALALIVNIIVSLITKKPSKEIQDEFDSIKSIEI